MSLCLRNTRSELTDGLWEDFSKYHGYSCMLPVINNYLHP